MANESNDTTTGLEKEICALRAKLEKLQALARGQLESAIALRIKLMRRDARFLCQDKIALYMSDETRSYYNVGDDLLRYPVRVDNTLPVGDVRIADGVTQIVIRNKGAQS